LWFTLQSGSGKGLARLLESRADRRLELEGYDCTGDASHQGENVVWGPCAVRYRRGGKPAVERLFGLIVQRDGQFKFVSYANRL
ncbi:MAG TPA: hypothetical protein VFN08_10140, partial [Gemmatimonadales bacterium]|nr:hypothetical protein [Gemmatimonadales bacterium]